MSESANIGFKQGQGTIYLYQHWIPDHLFKHYAQALKAAEARWDDEAYCTRIMISHLIGKENWGSEYGFGISIEPYDTDHKTVIVDFKNKRMRLYDGDSELFSLSFPRFVEKYA